MNTPTLPALPPLLAANPRLDRWVGFSAPGRVTVSTGRVEIGQGVLTAMLQIAAELDRLAARRIAFIGGEIRIPAPQQDAIGGDVELLGGDLQHRGQHPLADLDPAGRNVHPARRGEPDPLIEARIGGEQRRQCR